MAKLPAPERLVRIVCLAVLPLVVAAAAMLGRSPEVDIVAEGTDPTTGPASSETELDAGSAEARSEIISPKKKKKRRKKKRSKKRRSGLSTRRAGKSQVAAAQLPLAAPRRASSPRRSGSARASAAQVPGAPRCGSIEVRLITQSEDSEFSSASIAERPESEARDRQIGDSVGAFRIRRIEWDHVGFDGPSGRCAVGIHSGTSRTIARQDSVKKGFEMAFVDAGAAPSEPSLPEAKPWWLSLEISSGIDRRGPRELQLDENSVRLIYAQARVLLGHVQLQELGTAEDPRGLRIGEIRVDSLLDHLGLESHDVVLALDGQPTNTSANLVRRLVEAREARALSAKIDRGGESFELQLRLKD